MGIGALLRPRTVAEAVTFAAAGNVRFLAGGTDHFPAEAKAAAWSRPSPDALIDLSGVAELRAIEIGETETRIGAAVRWSEIERSTLPPGYRALQLAARQIGGIQIQSRGTVGGNLCNASPAADGVPPLLILDAQVELRSVSGSRRLALSDFLIGPRRTALRPGEILTAVAVPRSADGLETGFQKLGSRTHLVISIAMVAIGLRLHAGRIRAAAIAVGACSPVALRLYELEHELRDLPARTEAIELPAPRHVAALAPIDDVRASALYRREAVLELVRRGLAEIVDGSRPDRKLGAA